MRVLKENVMYYESFQETLPILSREEVSGELKLLSTGHIDKTKTGDNSNNEKLSRLLELQFKISKSNNLQELERHFANYIITTLKLDEPNLFFIDENYSVIESVSHNDSIRTKAFLNSLLSAGVIKQIIEKKNSIVLPNNLLNSKECSKSFYLLMPLTTESKDKRCFVAKVSPNFKTDSSEATIIKIGLDLISNRIKFLEKQQELKKAYSELQIFQSRLANDYKLSAIGELTTGILEDILSPLQVITSYTDFAKKENNPEFNSVLNTITLQAKKINLAVNRLINFAKPVEGKFKLQPCDINEFIIEFYNVVISTLKKDNYECILDLEKNIPEIISHPNYINQALMNVFLLLKPSGNKAGGVLIQSKYLDAKVAIKFFTTDYYPHLEKDTIAKTKDISIKIIQNLIYQHQGELKINSEETNGTIITILFPIKRNM